MTKWPEPTGFPAAWLERICSDRPGVGPGSPGSYLVAAALISAAVALRIAITPLVEGVQFITLFPAVIVTTFLSGMTAGFCAVALGSAAAALLLVEPGAVTMEFPRGAHLASLAFFVSVASLDVLLVGALRSTVAALQSGKAELSALAASSPDAVLLVEPSGRILRASPQAEAVFRIPVASLVGRMVEDLVPERLREGHARHRAAFELAPRRREMGAGLSLTGRRGDGSEVPIDVHLAPLVLGRKPLIACTVRDITEQVELARRVIELRQEQAGAAERLRAADELKLWGDVFQNAAFGIAVGDARAERLRVANPAFAAMRGMTIAEVTGIRIRDLYAPGEFPRIQRVIEESTRVGHAECETVHLRKDGSQFPIHLSLTTVRGGDGFPAYRIASVIDISDRRRAEADLQHAQRIEIFGSLASGIAHDFNNLLGVIIGNLDLADGKLAEPRTRELVHEALEAALRGASLTRHLLAFARRQPLHPESLQLGEVLSGLGALLRRLLGTYLELDMDLEADVGSVFADRTQIEASLINLAVNARDAMPNGGTLTISARGCRIGGPGAPGVPHLPAGEYAVIEVRDTGTGMSAEVLARSFEPFFTTKEPGQGTGLGLSSVQGFARQSGGDVQIESVLGRGTTVRIYLPRSSRQTLAAVAAIPATLGEPSSAAPQRTGRGEVVLVVEDDAGLRRVTTRELRDLGYRVVEASDAAAALDILERETVHLVFSDVRMPGPIDGLDLARTVAQRWPACRILLTSGHSEGPIASTEEPLPVAVPLLDKPYRLPRLAAVLRELLDDQTGPPALSATSAGSQREA